MIKLPTKILPRVIITYGACARGAGRRRLLFTPERIFFRTTSARVGRGVVHVRARAQETKMKIHIFCAERKFNRTKKNRKGCKMWQRDENHLALWMLACTMDVGMLSQGYDRSTSAQQGLVSKSGHVKLQPLYTFFCYTSTGEKCYCERYSFLCTH